MYAYNWGNPFQAAAGLVPNRPPLLPGQTQHPPPPILGSNAHQQHNMAMYGMSDASFVDPNAAWMTPGMGYGNAHQMPMMPMMAHFLPMQNPIVAGTAQTSSLTGLQGPKDVTQNKNVPLTRPPLLSKEPVNVDNTLGTVKQAGLQLNLAPPPPPPNPPTSPARPEVVVEPQRQVQEQKKQMGGDGGAPPILSDQEFEMQLNAWNRQFENWREQNQNHPDREAYRRYEKQWQDWRQQLLVRREQMRELTNRIPAAIASAPAKDILATKEGSSEFRNLNQGNQRNVPGANERPQQTESEEQPSQMPKRDVGLAEVAPIRRGEPTVTEVVRAGPRPLMEIPSSKPGNFPRQTETTLKPQQPQATSNVWSGRTPQGDNKDFGQFQEEAEEDYYEQGTEETDDRFGGYDEGQQFDRRDSFQGGFRGRFQAGRGPRMGFPGSNRGRPDTGSRSLLGEFNVKDRQSYDFEGDSGDGSFSRSFTGQSNLRQRGGSGYNDQTESEQMGFDNSTGNMRGMMRQFPNRGRGLLGRGGVEAEEQYYDEQYDDTGEGDDLHQTGVTDSLNRRDEFGNMGFQDEEDDPEDQGFSRNVEPRGGGFRRGDGLLNQGFGRGRGEFNLRGGLLGRGRGDFSVQGGRGRGDFSLQGGRGDSSLQGGRGDFSLQGGRGRGDINLQEGRGMGNFGGQGGRGDFGTQRGRGGETFLGGRGRGDSLLGRGRGDGGLQRGRGRGGLLSGGQDFSDSEGLGESEFSLGRGGGGSLLSKGGYGEGSFQRGRGRGEPLLSRGGFGEGSFQRGRGGGDQGPMRGMFGEQGFNRGRGRGEQGFNRGRGRGDVGFNRGGRLGEQSSWDTGGLGNFESDQQEMEGDDETEEEEVGLGRRSGLGGFGVGGNDDMNFGMKGRSGSGLDRLERSGNVGFARGGKQDQTFDRREMQDDFGFQRGDDANVRDFDVGAGFGERGRGRGLSRGNQGFRRGGMQGNVQGDNDFGGGDGPRGSLLGEYQEFGARAGRLGEQEFGRGGRSDATDFEMGGGFLEQDTGRGGRPREQQGFQRGGRIGETGFGSAGQGLGRGGRIGNLGFGRGGGPGEQGGGRGAGRGGRQEEQGGGGGAGRGGNIGRGGGQNIDQSRGRGGRPGDQTSTRGGRPVEQGLGRGAMQGDQGSMTGGRPGQQVVPGRGGVQGSARGGRPGEQGAGRGIAHGTMADGKSEEQVPERGGRIGEQHLQKDVGLQRGGTQGLQEVSTRSAVLLDDTRFAEDDFDTGALQTSPQVTTQQQKNLGLQTQNLTDKHPVKAVESGKPQQPAVGSHSQGQGLPGVAAKTVGSAKVSVPVKPFDPKETPTGTPAEPSTKMVPQKQQEIATGSALEVAKKDSATSAEKVDAQPKETPKDAEGSGTASGDAGDTAENDPSAKPQRVSRFAPADGKPEQSTEGDAKRQTGEGSATADDKSDDVEILFVSPPTHPAPRGARGGAGGQPNRGGRGTVPDRGGKPAAPNRGGHNSQRGRGNNDDRHRQDDHQKPWDRNRSGDSSKSSLPDRNDRRRSRSRSRDRFQDRSRDQSRRSPGPSRYGWDRFHQDKPTDDGKFPQRDDQYADDHLQGYVPFVPGSQRHQGRGGLLSTPIKREFGEANAPSSVGMRLLSMAGGGVPDDRGRHFEPPPAKVSRFDHQSAARGPGNPEAETPLVAVGGTISRALTDKEQEIIRMTAENLKALQDQKKVVDLVSALIASKPQGTNLDQSSTDWSDSNKQLQDTSLRSTGPLQASRYSGSNYPNQMTRDDYKGGSSYGAGQSDAQFYEDSFEEDYSKTRNFETENQPFYLRRESAEDTLEYDRYVEDEEYQQWGEEEQYQEDEGWEQEGQYGQEFGTWGEKGNMQAPVSIDYGHKSAGNARKSMEMDSMFSSDRESHFGPEEDYGHGDSYRIVKREPDHPPRMVLHDDREPYSRDRGRDSNRGASGSTDRGRGPNRGGPSRKGLETDRRDQDRDRYGGDRHHGREGRPQDRDRQHDSRHRDHRDSRPLDRTEEPKNKHETVLIEDLIGPEGRCKRPQRIVIILRGLPGSGKTYVAKLIKDKELEHDGGSGIRMLCLDDYWIVDDEKDGKGPVYKYDSAMEDRYRASLYKSFRRTVDDGFFPFIIVDSIHNKVKHFDKIWSYAKQKGFQVYIAEMDTDVTNCHKRNIHNRSLDDIKKILKFWERTPSQYIRVDVRSLLQDAAIPEVEMEDTNFVADKPIPAADKATEVSSEVGSSRWEKMEATEEKLAKLDGLRSLKKRDGPKSFEDYLQLPDDYELRTTELEPGKKRVRWADVEERKHQERKRALGFVIGQTDWEAIVDPTHADKALTRTKYI